MIPMEKLEHNQSPDTCEYDGVVYIVATDLKSKKDFITVNGKKLFLDKNGNVAQKQPGGRNAKDCESSYDDLQKIHSYLLENKMWNIYLLFMLNYNLSRRIDDILNLKWSDLFDENWKMKKFWSLTEGKTGKINDIKLNKAVRIAFKTYFDNESAFEKTEKFYNQYMFMQLHGTHKGKVISQSGYRKALVKIGDELQLEKKLRSHSFRRGAFTNMLESHPNDPKAKTIIMDISKHSSEKMLSHYIGEADKLKEKYLDDLGDDFEKYVINGEEVPFQKRVPQVVCNTSKLLECMRDSAMYFMVKGMENAGETDPKIIMEMMNDAMKKVEEILENVAE